MTDQPDGLEHRIDDAFEQAISQQLAEQREIRRLVAQVEESLIFLTEGYNTLSATMAEQSSQLRSHLDNDYGSISTNIAQVLGSLQHARGDINAELLQSVALLQEAASNARDTNGTVLQNAVIDVQKALAAGNERTKAAIEALRGGLTTNSEDVVREVADLNQTIRQSLASQTQEHAATLAMALTDFKGELEQQAKRDETLLRQAIGAIEDRMDYGQGLQQQQFDAAQQNLSDQLQTQELARQAFANNLDEVIAVFSSDQSVRAQQLEGLQRHVTNMVQEVVTSSHNQFEVAISSLERATTGLHEDRDEGREDFQKSLATLAAVNEVQTRRLQQMNEMIDELRSSTEGLEPVITEAVNDFSSRLQAQLNSESTHSEALVARLENASDQLQGKVSESLETVIAAFKKEAATLRENAQTREENALNAVTDARAHLEQLALSNGEQLQAQQDANTAALQTVASSVQTVANEALESITINVVKATSELLDVQNSTIESATLARTSMVDTTKILAKQIEGLEPAIRDGLAQVVSHVETLTSELNNDLRSTSTYSSATMRDVAADVHGQLTMLSTTLREEISNAQERSRSIAEADRSRLERVTTDLSAATESAESAMHRLVEETRSHISTVRSDTLDALRSAADLIAEAGQTFPDRLDESTNLFSGNAKAAADLIVESVDGLHDSISGQLAEIAQAASQIIEQTNRTGDVYLDQVTLLRQSVEQAITDFAKNSQQASSKWRTNLEDSVHVIKTEMVQRIDEASAHLREQTSVMSSTHAEGIDRIETVSQVLLDQLKEVQGQVTGAIEQTKTSLADQAVSERGRIDETIVRLTGVVDHKIANLENAVTSAREFAQTLQVESSRHNEETGERFVKELGDLASDVASDVKNETKNAVEQAQIDLSAAIETSVESIRAALHEAETMSATHMGSTAQTITEAEEAYRRATARLEEAVDSSRREIERSVEQTALNLERRTNQISEHMAKEVSSNIATSLAEVKTELAGQLDRVSAREEAGVTRLYDVASRVEDSLSGLDITVSSALSQVLDYRSDPVNEVIDEVQNIRGTLAQTQKDQTNTLVEAIEAMERRFENRLAQFEQAAKDREDLILSRVERSVSGVVEHALAAAVDTLEDRVANAIALQQSSLEKQEQALDNLQAALIEEIHGVIADTSGKVQEAMDQLTSKGREQQDQLVETFNKATQDVTRNLAETQGREIDRISGAAQTLQELNLQDRKAERKRGDEIVAGVSKAVSEIAAATERLVGMDDRVVARVSRSLEGLRTHLTDEVRSVTREIGTRPVSGAAFFAPPQTNSASGTTGAKRSEALRNPVTPSVTNRSLDAARARASAKPPLTRESRQANTTCPDCGFVARTVIGLTTHQRSCTKR